jgi:hypothetical protein
MRTKKQLSNVDKQKLSKLVKKIENFNFKNIINKIHKLTIKKLELNVNHHIETSKTHKLL